MLMASVNIRLPLGHRYWTPSIPFVAHEEEAYSKDDLGTAGCS